jgi:hypothetical protein
VVNTRYVLIGLVVILVACDKKANGSSSAASAAAPAAAVAGPLHYTTGDPEIAGDYDGTKAIANMAFGRTVIRVPRNCSLTCDDLQGSQLDSEKVKKSCPQGYVMTVEVEKELTPGGKLPMTNIGNSNIGKGSANGLVVDGATTNQFEVVSSGERTVAKIDFKSTETVSGTISFSMCKSP